jgi:hypothetical protein
MPNTSAIGVTVRHAVTRALATANLAPSEATWRVLSARAWARGDGSVGRAEVTLHIAAPRPLAEWERHELTGWVNPDGLHPNMSVLEGGDPLFADIHPVTWDEWLQHVPDRLPDRIDPLCPRTEVGLDAARAFAAARGKRLPTAEEFQRMWGPARYPWGESRDAALGRPEAPRFGEVHEVGAHPPRKGLFDVGAWLWHWMADGSVSGGLQAGRPAFGVACGPEPVGFRCVCDATADQD